MDNELLNLQGEELRQKLLQSKNPEEIDDLVNLFNLNIKKKEIIRADIYSDLQDKVTDQIGKRIENNSDMFSNKDLLDYMNSIQNIIDKRSKIEDNKIPTIAIQNNLTISGQENILEKDSRDRIKEVIQNILKEQNNFVLEKNIVENQGEVKGVE